MKAVPEPSLIVLCTYTVLEKRNQKKGGLVDFPPKQNRTHCHIS
jgi:hypothetical protein